MRVGEGVGAEVAAQETELEVEMKPSRHAQVYELPPSPRRRLFSFIARSVVCVGGSASNSALSIPPHVGIFSPVFSCCMLVCRVQ
jgi:hypothetical protein